MTPAEDLQRRALDAPRRDLGEIAAVLGVSYETATSYRAQRRRMPSEARAKLAEYLRTVSSELEALAEELEASSSS